MFGFVEGGWVPRMFGLWGGGGWAPRMFGFIEGAGLEGCLGLLRGAVLKDVQVY